MTTTELIPLPRVSSSPDAAPSPTFGDVLDEIVPLIGVVLVAGPPATVLVAPWLLFGLMLAGPFALLVTVVVVLVAVAAVVRLIRAIVAAPYLLFRHLRRYRGAHVSMRAPAVPLVAGESRWHPA